MDTLVLEQGNSTYLVNSARLVKTDDEAADYAAEATVDWNVDKSNPFVQWIAGDFVEADNANQNGQFWTAGDLELAEYSIRYAPLNMVHKFRQPIGFYAATKTVKLDRKDAALKLVKPEEKAGSMKIQALSGLWTHIFPFEAAQAEAADDANLLFYSMECRGTHLTCGTDEARGLQGCGETFDYMQVDTHCEHLLERSSVRHIVSPTFRGGALIVPPVRPGWKNANASILTEAVMQEAASFAEQNEKAYNQLNADGTELSASAWEQRLSVIQVKTPEPAFDALLNHWVLYQALACRMWARSATYQSSGAFGFRDQLQDVLAFVYADPAIGIFDANSA